MNKIKGVGEIHEGVLEKEPLNESYQIRGVDADGRQVVISLDEVYRDYVGQHVRLTIALTASLLAEARRMQTEIDVQPVGLDELGKS